MRVGGAEQRNIGGPRGQHANNVAQLPQPLACKQVADRVLAATGIDAGAAVPVAATQPHDLPEAVIKAPGKLLCGVVGDTRETSRRAGRRRKRPPPLDVDSPPQDGGGASPWSDETRMRCGSVLYVCK